MIQINSEKKKTPPQKLQNINSQKVENTTTTKMNRQEKREEEPIIRGAPQVKTLN
jgi:hypothetical protein